jgi:hypothetical protein
MAGSEKDKAPAPAWRIWSIDSRGRRWLVGVERAPTAHAALALNGTRMAGARRYEAERVV